MSGVNELAGILEGVKSNSKGAKLFKILNVKSNIFKSMHAPIGSQYKSFITGVTWSDLIPEAKRAAQF